MVVDLLNYCQMVLYIVSILLHCFLGHGLESSSLESKPEQVESAP